MGHYDSDYEYDEEKIRSKREIRRTDLIKHYNQLTQAEKVTILIEKLIEEELNSNNPLLDMLNR